MFFMVTINRTLATMCDDCNTRLETSRTTTTTAETYARAQGWITLRDERVPSYTYTICPHCKQGGF